MTERIALGFDRELAPAGSSALARPFQLGDVRVGNRFCVLPMEGWDGTLDGEPSDLTTRRWQHFGKSGAKLIWGGEAVAVRHDGRANPTSTAADAAHAAGDRAAARGVDRGASRRFGADADDDLLHRPAADALGTLRETEPARTARADRRGARNPVLDRAVRTRRARSSATTSCDRLIDDFIAAARLAADAGLRFVDVKHCHGYLGHELLGAHAARRGPFGGSLENRTRFMREIIDGIRAAVARPERRGAPVGVRRGPAPQGAPTAPATPAIDPDALPLRLRRAHERRPRRAPSVKPGRSCRCSRIATCGGSASPPAARTTARTCSGRPSSRRATATSRRRIRSHGVARLLDATRC